MTAKVIQNCFRKTGLKIQFVDQEDDSIPAKEVDVKDLVHLFNEMKVEINHQLIEQFVQIDDENSPGYAEAIAIENQQAIDELEEVLFTFMMKKMMRWLQDLVNVNFVGTPSYTLKLWKQSVSSLVKQHLV